jgi:hypothetical protein
MVKPVKKPQKVVRLIACAVFKPALDFLAMKERYPHLKVTYLPSYLHLKPPELQKRLLKEIIKARKGGERIVCLYGDCFPDIDEFCRRHEAVKVPGHYCYEMLLGPERFKQYLDEIAGTYFLEQDVIQNFETYCMKPLGLRDEEMRKYCFEHYQRVLYIRQPDDVDLESKACDIADFLDLHMDASDADYSYLENRLAELL